MSSLGVVHLDLAAFGYLESFSGSSVRFKFGHFILSFFIQASLFSRFRRKHHYDITTVDLGGFFDICKFFAAFRKALHHFKTEFGTGDLSSLVACSKQYLL